jgi:dihydrofolate synthase/folylpolyglutamate synthase
MLDAMLRAQGLKVGAYTSPHLQQVNERIAVGGIDIDDDTLSELLERIDGERRAWTAREGFDPDPDAHVLRDRDRAAFAYFLDQKVDVAVLEVGLGGRLDATNIVPKPLATAITSIGMDHMEVLGDDLASIAAEKAGIIKPGRARRRRAAPAARREGRARRSPPIAAPSSSSAGRTACRESPTTSRSASATSPSAAWPRASTATIRSTTPASRSRSPNSFPSRSARRRKRSAAACAWRATQGRNEWLAPDLLVDCAHNADGAAQLAAYLRQLPRDRRRTLLLGVSKDKTCARSSPRSRRGRSGDLSRGATTPRAATPRISRACSWTSTCR